MKRCKKSKKSAKFAFRLNKTYNMNHYCIILAGGCGQRLWPVSTFERPKQFLDLFGTGRTLLQQTYDRIVKFIPNENIIVSTIDVYVPLVREQLPQLPENNIFVEDVKLSTGPAVASAALKLSQRDEDASVLVTPADHLILNEDAFCAQMGSAMEKVENSQRFFALGATATQPNTTYGYIQKGDTVIFGLYKVKAFIEKPDMEYAEMFVESDEFLWNTGLFVWRLQTMLPLARDIMDEVSAKSIDSILLERHAENVLVEECHFGWSDVGSWSQLQKLSHRDVDGNALVIDNNKVMLEGCANNIIALKDGYNAIIKDMKNYLVALNEGMLLICPKDSVDSRKLIAKWEAVLRK